MSWLVRSPQHQITGLFSKEDLINKILAGEYSSEFEVCSGNGYWIYLHETEELQSQLGITLPAHMLAQASGTPEEAQGEITEDFPEESSRTMQVNPALVKAKIKAAPLAPRNSEVVPPPAPFGSKPGTLVKVIIILVGLLGIALVLKN
ncbi:MAG: hypothetical protein KA715_06985 [Xanthomonadaceae bacterium]|nr:hypothetical protein [Xanthomonadaceae bacterium]